MNTLIRICAVILISQLSLIKFLQPGTLRQEMLNERQIQPDTRKLMVEMLQNYPGTTMRINRILLLGLIQNLAFRDNYINVFWCLQANWGANCSSAVIGMETSTIGWKLPQSLTLNGEVCVEISLRQCITIRYHVKIHILGTANCSHITQEMGSQSCEINSFRSGFQTTLILSGTSDAGIDSSWCKAADVVPDCCTALISDVEKKGQIMAALVT